MTVCHFPRGRQVSKIICAMTLSCPYFYSFFLPYLQAWHLFSLTSERTQGSWIRIVYIQSCCFTAAQASTPNPFFFSCKCSIRHVVMLLLLKLLHRHRRSKKYTAEKNITRQITSRPTIIIVTRKRDRYCTGVSFRKTTITL